LNVVLFGRTAFRPWNDVIKVNVIIGNGHPAGPTNLVLSLQHPELDRPGDVTANISQFLCLRERLGSEEDWTFMPKYPTGPMRLRFGQRKALDQRAIRAVFQFPARLTYSLNSPIPVNFFCPLLYGTFFSLPHAVLPHGGSSFLSNMKFTGSVSDPVERFVGWFFIMSDRTD
jgi:hypothetical protein